MNVNFKKRWLDALRSGKYKQGREFLCVDNQYCCLGVLCDVIDNTKWKKCEDGINEYYMGSYGYRDDCLESDMLIFTGLSFNDQSILTTKNDSGESFEQIADWIEKNL